MLVMGLTMAMDLGMAFALLHLTVDRKVLLIIKTVNYGKHDKRI